MSLLNENLSWETIDNAVMQMEANLSVHINWSSMRTLRKSLRLPPALIRGSLNWLAAAVLKCVLPSWIAGDERIN